MQLCSRTGHVNGEVAGQVKNYDKLTFLQVEGAGHMVPKDQPKSSLDMLKTTCHLTDSIFVIHYLVMSTQSPHFCHNRVIMLLIQL